MRRRKVAAILAGAAGFVVSHASRSYADLFDDFTDPSYTANLFTERGYNGPNLDTDDYIDENNLVPSVLTLGKNAGFNQGGPEVYTQTVGDMNFWEHPVEMSITAPVGGNLIPTNATGPNQANLYLGVNLGGGRLDAKGNAIYIELSNADTTAPDNNVYTNYLIAGGGGVIYNTANPSFAQLITPGDKVTKLMLTLDGSQHSNGILYINWGIDYTDASGNPHEYWLFNDTNSTVMVGNRKDANYGQSGFALGKDVNALYNDWTNNGATAGDSSAAIELLRVLGDGGSTSFGIDTFSVTNEPPAATWNTNINFSDWALAANWSPYNPNALGAVANFGSKITAPTTVNMTQPQTVSQINFDNSNSYTIASTSTLTFDNSTNAVGVSVASGSHTIAAPVQLHADKDATFTVTPAASMLTISDLQPSTVNITKAGAGTLLVNNVLANSLTISGGTVSVAAGRSTAGTSNITSLSITGATLNLNDQDMVIDYGSGASPLASVAAAIKSGYANGAWNGTGMNSAVAATTVGTGHPTALGFGEASAVSISSLSGQTWTGGAVLIRYTYAGDADLDGTVGVNDFNALAANFNKPGTWTSGDFNNDGIVNASDFALLASNYGQTLSSPPLLGTLVPEPTTLALFACAGLLSIRRRRQ